MANKAGERREKREREERTRSVSLACVATVIGALLFVFPRTTSWIVIDLAIVFAFAIYPVWHCGGFRASWSRRLVLLILTIIVLGVIGWAVWPRIIVSPDRMTLHPSETLDFRLENDRSDDAYMVTPLFKISGDDPTRLNVSLDGQPRLSTGTGQPLAEVIGAFARDAKGQDFLMLGIQRMYPHERRWIHVYYQGSRSVTITKERVVADDEPMPFKTKQIDPTSVDERIPFRAPMDIAANSMRLIFASKRERIP